MLDRLEALRIFVAIAEEGSFVRAARRLQRSPAAVTRAVSDLEARFGTRLLTRTTRAVALTEAGGRCLEQARQVLGAYGVLEQSASRERSGPAGLLTISAPEMFGRLHILPIAQRYLCTHPGVQVSLLLLNRLVSFVDEGVDLGVRIAQLADSSLRAIQVGAVRRVVCASPGYLSACGVPQTPQDLRNHDVIAVADARPPTLRWPFAGSIGVAVTPRLMVNTVQAALDAAVADGGVIRVLSYQAGPLEEAGRLTRVLRDHEPAPIPIHIVHPAGRYLSPTVRLFIDAAVPELRSKFADRA
ncbi:MAG TPA: LysR family transcriptional regulator [Stellaceae bacterium]|nr:LysR family transcriptional regulator [Stellaceae bacterium]